MLKKSTNKIVRILGSQYKVFLYLFTGQSHDFSGGESGMTRTSCALPLRRSDIVCKQPTSLAILEARTLRVRPLASNPAPVSQGRDSMAERQGFEPWAPQARLWFSRPVHSTALPSLRVFRVFSKSIRIIEET